MQWSDWQHWSRPWTPIRRYAPACRTGIDRPLHTLYKSTVSQYALHLASFWWFALRFETARGDLRLLKCLLLEGWNGWCLVEAVIDNEGRMCDAFWDTSNSIVLVQVGWLLFTEWISRGRVEGGRFWFFVCLSVSLLQGIYDTIFKKLEKKRRSKKKIKNSHAGLANYTLDFIRFREKKKVIHNLLMKAGPSESGRKKTQRFGTWYHCTFHRQFGPVSH